MADFNISYKITIGINEGGYNPGKGEAETYAGWDRSKHPDWTGWPLVDGIKKANPGAQITMLNRLFAANAQLQLIVKEPYLTDFWNNIKLSNVNDQQIANNLFDCSVNPCIDTAAKVMQKACNAAIINTGANIKQLTVDGQIGKLTIAAVNSLDASHVFNAINTIRAANYHERIILTPSMKSWLPVWLKRLVKYI